MDVLRRIEQHGSTSERGKSVVGNLTVLRQLQKEESGEKGISAVPERQPFGRIQDERVASGGRPKIHHFYRQERSRKTPIRFS